MEKTINQNILNNHSPAYYQMYQKWVDALDLYEPLPGSLFRFITKHTCEDDSEHRVRATKTPHINILKLGIGFYTSMLFSTNIRINSKSVDASIKSKLEAFKKKATKKGEPLTEFFRKKVFPSVALMGNGDVFVDMAVKDTSIVTMADEDAVGAPTPYCWFVPSINRVRWQTNDEGQYTFYQAQDQIDTLVNPQFQIKQISQYQVWTPDEIGIYNKSGQQVSEKPNPHGFIPAVSVIPFGSVRFFDDELGMGLVDDQILIQKEVINTLSMVGDFHRQINFSQFVLQNDPDAGEPPEQSELKEMGNNRAMSTHGKAYFVSPDPSGVQAMSCHADWLITKAFQLLLIPADSNNIKTHTSEQSIRNNLARLNTLTDIARQLERSLKRIVEMSLSIQDVDPADAQIEVVWDTGFTPESFINAITELTAFNTSFASASPTATREMLKQVVAGKLYGTDLMQVIEEEISKWNVAQGIVPTSTEQTNGQGDVNVAPVQRINEFAGQANKVVQTEE